VPRELRPDAVRLLAAAGHEVRWAILRALASTTATALSVNDIAQSTGENANLVSKHIGVLRAAGAIAVRDDVPGDARRQMYAVPEVYRVAGTVPALDYGSCLLRFD
jgi:predicted transcriptional regulator